ncbi:uncharacterized protein LOC144906710 isoform X2 [Branchiostoma floridae x Branchiostoma belcheri]
MGHVNILVRLLIRKGASVTKKSIGISCAPLHGAAIRGSTKVVELLVHHGATVDTRDAFQRTPIMMACLFKHVDTVRRLIEFGARVDLRDCGPVSVLGYCEVDAGAEVCVCAHDRTMKLIQEAMETKLLRCCNPTCGKPGYRSTLKLCGRCKLTRYCSRDCQKQHWSVGHKKSCGHDTYTGDEPTVFEGAVMTAKWGDLVKPLPTNCTC